MGMGVMFLVIADSTSVVAEDWPMYGCNLRNTHLQTGEGAMIDSVTVKWVYNTGDSATNIIPALADIDRDGYLEIIAGINTTLYAFNHNGGILWTHKIGEIVSSPAIADIDKDGIHEVVIGSKNSYMYALNNDGSILWSYQTGGEIISSPAIADIEGDGFYEVVFGSKDNKMYALNAEDGTLLWNYPTPGEIVSSPAVADIDNDNAIEIVFGSKNGRVYALQYDAKLVWSYQTGDSITSSPAIADIDGDDTLEVVIGSLDKKLYCLNGAYGEVKWSYPLPNSAPSYVAIADLNKNDSLEIITANIATLLCLNREGELWWENTLRCGAIQGNPAIADIDGNGYLEVIAPWMTCIVCVNHDGTILGDIGVGDSYSPVIGDIDADGKLEIVSGTADGKLYVFDSDGTITAKGAISGSVKDTANAPIVNAYVHAFSCEGVDEGEAYTDSLGNYLIENLIEVPGEYYVEVFASGYVHEYYDNVTELQSATSVKVVANDTITDINFILASEDTSKESISGNVVDGNTNEPLLCIVVAFSNKANFSITITDTLGNYTVENLKSDSHYIYAWAPGYIGKFYNNVINWEDATQVKPTADDIDFVLEPTTRDGSSSIVGTITSNTNEALENVLVYAIKNGKAIGCARSQANGRYVIDKLPIGTYTFQASRPFYGTTDYSQPVEITEDRSIVSGIDMVINEIGIEERKTKVEKTYLSIKSSNPVIGQVVISYHLQAPTHTILKIYNTCGQLVRKLVDAPQKVDSYTITWDGKDDSGKKVTSGIYFCKLETNKFSAVKKITLIR
jgi:outer membrane protein assembly factor BamB